MRNILCSAILGTLLALVSCSSDSSSANDIRKFHASLNTAENNNILQQQIKNAPASLSDQEKMQYSDYLKKALVSDMYRKQIQHLSQKDKETLISVGIILSEDETLIKGF